MDFELSVDQVALRDELRRFLTDRVTHDSRWAAAEQPGGVDRGLWSELANLGVFGIATPEADGGVGLGLADATIVFEELGRAAVPGPTIATFLAATLVRGAIDGSVVVGMIDAGTDAGGPQFIEHLEGLDSLLVHYGDRIEEIAEPTGVLLPRPMDPLTPVSMVDAIDPGNEVAGSQDAAIAMRNGRLLAAAFQVGLGQAAIDLGTAYAKDRQQFGRVIGTFQAVKHILADAVVGIDIARAGVHAAAVAIDEAADAGRIMTVDGARLVASHAAQAAGEASIQVHGGIGYTWELDAHLFLKRSFVLDTMFGTVEASVDAMAATL